MSTHDEIARHRILGWLTGPQAEQARANTEPPRATFPEPYHPIVRAGLHPDVVAAYSWMLHKRAPEAQRIVDKLSHKSVTAALTACADLAIRLGERAKDLREQSRCLPWRLAEACAYCGDPICTDRFNHDRWFAANETVIRRRANGMKP